MKQTLNINLAGLQFVIDDDAYNLLRDYLDTLSHLYHNSSDAAEIVEDVEMRIAELFTTQMANPSTIITLQMTQEVISRIGKPEDIADVEITRESPSQQFSEEIHVEDAAGSAPPPLPGQEPLVEKRLFRDPNDKLIGGVCSGVAKYIGVDPTWVRLAAVLLFFLSYSTAAVIYIILWIVLPIADTPYKQMQMEGKSATFDNIGNTVNRVFSSRNASAPTAPRSNNANNFLRGFINVIMIIVGIICFPIVFALISVIIAMLIGITGSFFGLSTIISDTLLDCPGGSWLALAIAGGCITLIIPLIAMIYMIFRGDNHNLPKSARISLLAVWILGILALITGGIVAANNDTIEYMKENHVSNIFINDDEVEDIDKEEARRIKVTVDSVVNEALRKADNAIDRAATERDSAENEHSSRIER